MAWNLLVARYWMILVSVGRILMGAACLLQAGQPLPQARSRGPLHAGLGQAIGSRGPYSMAVP